MTTPDKIRELAEDVAQELSGHCDGVCNQPFFETRIESALRSVAVKPEWHPMFEAPKDGTRILGRYSDSEAVEIRWAEQRRCMLAGVGGGNGYYGAGWEDCENGLIADTPTAWKEIREVE